MSHKHIFPLALLLAWGGGGHGLSAGEGYLHAGGPVPLRWEAPAPVNPERLRLLPPLGLEDKPAMAPVSDMGMRTNSPVALSSEPANSNTNALSQEDPGQASYGQAPLGPASGLPPELLPTLFYEPGGTNHGTSLALPLNFVPPLAPGPRSSTAVYSRETP